MRPSERLLEAWYRLRGWYPVRIEEQPFRCDPDHISFWSLVSRNRWEAETLALLTELLHPDAVYCDIGAWIGPTVLHASGKCRRVYCLEPDREAYRYLLANIRYNRLENVLPFNLALADREGLCRLASPRGKRGDSMSSLLLPTGVNGMEVLALRWQTWTGLLDTDAFDCVKMDIEGGEYSLLPTMASYLARHKPKLLLALHPHLLSEGERVAAMTGVMEALAGYGQCLDTAKRPVKMQTLLQEPLVSRPASYLFTA